MSGGVKNILVRNCSYKGTELGIRIKSKRGRGSYVKNIWFENIEMEDINGEAIRINMFYPASSASSRTNTAPDFSNINLKNITCKGARDAIFIRGLPEHHIKELHFENVNITSKNGLLAINLNSAVFKDLIIVPSTGSAYSFDNCTNIELQNCTTSNEAKTFLQLTGEKTSAIRLTGINCQDIEERISISENVKQPAIIFE